MGKRDRFWKLLTGGFYKDRYGLDNKLLNSRRGSERVKFSMFVETETENSMSFTASGNISNGGIFLESRVPYKKGDILKLSFPIPRTRDWITVRGVVVNALISEDGKEMGLSVKFIDLTDNDVELINNYIEKKIEEDWFINSGAN